MTHQKKNNLDDNTFEDFFENNIELEKIVVNEKKRLLKLLESSGIELFSEIDEKNKLRNKDKKKKIKYILKKTSEYSYNELVKYDYFDILKIFNEIVGNKKSILLRIIDFFSNV